MNYHGQQTRPFPFWNLVSEKNKVEKHVFSQCFALIWFRGTEPWCGNGDLEISITPCTYITCTYISVHFCRYDKAYHAIFIHIEQVCDILFKDQCKGSWKILDLIYIFWLFIKCSRVKHILVDTWGVSKATR